MSHHFRSSQVIENVSKEEIVFSLCDEKNSMAGIFRGFQKKKYWKTNREQTRILLPAVIQLTWVVKNG